MTDAPILIAITNTRLADDASGVAAATGHPIIHTTTPADIHHHAPTAAAILTDDDNSTTLTHITTTAPIYHLTEDPGPPNYQQALAAHAHAAYTLPTDNAQLLTALSTTTTTTGISIGIMPATGGVGATTLTGILARYLAATQPITLIDTNPNSGGLDLLMGIEHTTGARWEDIHTPHGTITPEHLRAALPHTPDNIAVLTHSRSHTTLTPPPNPTTVENILAAAPTPNTLTLIDLPTPHTTPEQYYPHLTHTILVAAAEIRSLAAAATSLNHLTTTTHHTPHIILRHRGWSSLTKHDAEKILGRPITATYYNNIDLARAIETQGIPTTLSRTHTYLADTITTRLNI